MNIRQVFSAATVVGVSLVGVIATGAYAAQGPSEAKFLSPCKTVRHGTTDGILTTPNGEAPSGTNPVSTAVVTVRTEGVEATLPDNDAKALYLEQPASTVGVTQIRKMTYRTWQLASGVAVWSYQLPIDINGGTLGAGEFTTLVYEPYQDGQTVTGGKWQNWDALRNGQAKWWSTRSLPLVANGATQSFPTAWSTIIAAYPNATVLAYGLDLGKGAAGASARVDSLTFGTARSCVDHRWSTRYGRVIHHVSIWQIWRKWLRP